MSFNTYIAEVERATGQSIVLTTRGPGNEYLEVRLTEKYNELGEKTIDGLDSLRTNIRNPEDLEAAIRSLQLAIGMAPGYSWMADPLAEMTLRTANVLRDGWRRIDQAIEDADTGSRGNEAFLNARRNVGRDPLALDLDADGIETVGVEAGVLFDHNADGIRTGTGWVKADDGLLVLDRNGNGSIDSGRELFGVDTVLADGTSGHDAFAALADQDSNADGVFDAQDAQWANVRVWRDHNQDGISQADELVTLDSLGITGLDLAAHAARQTLAGGNVQTLAADIAGLDGAATALDLAQNPFYSQFTDTVAVTAEAQALPDMQGSGAVRSLREAASLSGELVAQLNHLATDYLTRAAFRAELDTLLDTWAATSTLESSTQWGLKASYYLQGQIFYWAPTLCTLGGRQEDVVTPEQHARQDALKLEQAELKRRLAILERFNGQTFVELGPDGRILLGDGTPAPTQYVVAAASDNGGSGVDSHVPLPIILGANQVRFLNEAYAALHESVYQGLVLQARLKPYLDAISLTIDEAGLRAEFGALTAALEARKATDPANALIDALELQRHAGEQLGGMGWEGRRLIADWVRALDGTIDVAAIADELKLTMAKTGSGADVVFTHRSGDIVDAGDGDDAVYGLDGNDLVFGRNGDDLIDGGKGADTLYGDVGDDTLMGGEANDSLHGGDSNDTLTGGTGNDYLDGGLGSDTYLFNLGDGQDTIYNYAAEAAGSGKVDVLQFGSGIDPAAVSVTRSGYDLVLSIAGTDDKVTVQGYFNFGIYTLDQIRFADGTGWDVQKIKEIAVTLGSGNSEYITGYDGAANRIYGLDGNDTVYGGNGGDLIDGGNGSDTLYGYGGDDTLIGGAGNDRLEGGLGSDTYLFNLGDGQDTISNYAAEAAGSGKVDVLRFGSGIDPAAVSVTRSGNDLALAVAGTTDKVTVQGYFWFGTYTLDQIQFADGTSWDVQKIKDTAITLGSGNGDYITGYDGAANRIYGLDGGDTVLGGNGDDLIDGGNGGDSLYGNAGNDTLTGGDGDDSFYGGDGDDTLSGGTGNDRLEGGLGSDTYLFNLGDGQDILSNSANDATGAKTDILRFGPGIAPAAVSVTRSGYDLVLAIAGTTDKVTVEGYFNFGNLAMDQIQFADGTTWDVQQIKAATCTVGTANGDSISGYNGASNWIYGLAGNDTIYGGDQGDSLNGDGGGDTLYGNGGADVIDGGDANDSIYGNAGDDTLTGGTGNDYLEGGLNSDTYLFNLGDGQDTINNNASDTAGSKTDILRFGPGIDPAAVSVTRSGYDLVLAVAGTTDKVTVQGYFWFGTHTLDQIRFTDGTSWDVQKIKDAAITLGSGNGDYITGYDGAANRIYGLDGNDTVYGGNGGDLIDGGNGGDTIYGYAGNDTLTGGDGSDSLYGGSGDDILTGGTGNDRFEGGLGSDSYRFNLGDGQDTIYNYAAEAAGSGRVDVFQFGPGIDPAAVSVTRSGNDLVLAIAGTTDKVTVQGYFNFGGYTLDQIQFADGSSWDVQKIKDTAITLGSGNGDYITGYDGAANRIYGLDGNDYLYGGNGNDLIDGGNGSDSVYGYAGNDTLTCGAGNDYLEGGLNSDTYLFNLGDGQDTIYNYAAEAVGSGKVDVLQFGAGIDPAAMSVVRNGQDLVLSIVGTLDKVTLRYYFNFGNFAVDQIRFADGTSWDVQKIKDTAITLGSAGYDSITGYDGAANRIYGLDGNDTVYGGNGGDLIDGGNGGDTLYGYAGNDALAGGDGNDSLYGGNSDDALAGGAGNDYLEGGLNSDTYLFNLGDGQDTIYNYAAEAAGSGKVDVLQFGAGIDPAAISVVRSGQDLVLSIAGTADKITVRGYFGFGTYTLDQIRFADGTSWDVQQIKDTAITLGSGNGDYITGYDGGANRIYGLDGNDTVYGGNGGDLIDGGNGGDTLYGYAGSDTLTGGDGSDSLYGGNGDDTLTGGTGNDYLEGGLNSDTYLFNLGNGQDTINNTASDVAGTKTDVLHFGPGIDPAAMSVVRSGQDLVLSVAGTADKVTVRGYFGFGTNTLDQIRFADGTSWDVQKIKDTAVTLGSGNGEYITGYDGGANRIYGLDGNDTVYGGNGGDLIDGGNGSDTLYGYGGDDTLIGGTGNDALTGGSGNDAYVLGRGDGADTVTESDSTAGNADLAQFGADIAADQLWFRRVGNNLEASIVGTSDSLTIQNWYSGSAYHVEQFRTADGKLLLDSQVENLVQAMAAFAPPAAGQTTLPPNYQDSLAPVIAANWH